jgi:uncharacterized protein with ATP-grasp and redox domains
MAERIVGGLNAWRSLRTNAAALLQSDLPSLPLSSFAGITNSDDLFGRSPLHPDFKNLVQRRLPVETSLMAEQQWMPAEFSYLVEQAWGIILEESRSLELPVLLTEKGLIDIARFAFRDEEIDLFGPHKTCVRDIFLNNLGEIRKAVAKALNPLARTFELALLGNRFGLGETTRLFEQSTVDIEKYIGSPLTCYINHSRVLLSALQTSRLQIVYLLDNAGESILDLLFIEKLLEMGHKVTVVGKAIPTLNDETFAEIQEIIADHGFSHPNLQVVNDGWDLPGVDLSRTPLGVQDAFGCADIAIVKGEGNFEGMPAHLSYSLPVFYLVRAKTPGLNQHVKEGGRIIPQRGQSFVYYKEADHSTWA